MQCSVEIESLPQQSRGRIECPRFRSHIRYFLYTRFHDLVQVCFNCTVFAFAVVLCDTMELHHNHNSAVKHKAHSVRWLVNWLPVDKPGWKVNNKVYFAYIGCETSFASLDQTRFWQRHTTPLAGTIYIENHGIASAKSL